MAVGYHSFYGRKGQVKVQQVPVLDPERALRQWRRRGLGVRLVNIDDQFSKPGKGRADENIGVRTCRPSMSSIDVVLDKEMG